MLMETLEEHIHKGPIIDNIIECSECESKHLTTDEIRGETICADCGLVLEDCAIDPRKEWGGVRIGDKEKEGSRGIGPLADITKADKNLSTLIGFKDRNNKPLPFRSQVMMHRIRKWQTRSIINTSRKLKLGSALGHLSKLISHMELPWYAKNQSAHLYRQVVHKNLLRGRTIEAMVAASIYTACRQLNIPRSLDEMAAASPRSKKEIGKAYRIIRDALSLDLPPTKPLDYLDRFCSKLRLSNNTQVYAARLLAIMDEYEIHINHNPVITTAVAIRYAVIKCKEVRTQDEIVDIIRITIPSVRVGYRELTNKLDELGITVR